MSKYKFLRLILISTIVVNCFSCKTNKTENGEDLNDYAHLVNPFIGTDYTGNTYPGAQVPFGMVQLSPDNGLPGWDRIAGYYYPDSTIAGFSHTHLSGTGAGDLYDISFMPVMIPYNEAEPPLGIHSKFSHSDEDAYAGYYRVLLSDYNINVELTATERTGIQRYTFPSGEAAVFLNLSKATNWDATLNTSISVVDSVTIEGYRFSTGWARDQRVYFRTRFSKPWNKISIDTIELENGGKGMNARFDFITTENDQLIIATALSGVDNEGAKKNLLAEAPHNDFDKYRNDAVKMWNKELSKINVESADTNTLKVFYTALYHQMIAPTIYSDVDGRYFGPDKQIHSTSGWTNYSTFSLWDTFRASQPLYTITQPNRVSDMIESFIAFYDQNGRLPVWNFQGGETDMMIGYHAVPVIAEAYLKGIGNFDANKALDACVKTANLDDYRGIGLYKNLGYVPYDVIDSYNADDWSLSRTLEYAYDDYCIAVMAEKMGETEIAKEFFKRSENYKNLFNNSNRFMVPRNSRGEWQPNFNPDEYTSHICESNGWQYFFSVPQNIENLVSLTGGKDRFATRLDSMFTYGGGKDTELPIFSTGMIGQYAHGNEPSHHITYLYNYVDQPWKTAYYVHEILNNFYTNTPAGLCGNEDCGQMSAWYVFSALGFYPVNPVIGKYEIGSPLFKKATINLDNGKKIELSAPNVSDKNIYIKSMKVNGKRWQQPFIFHSDLMNGAKIEFEMTDKKGIIWFK